MASYPKNANGIPFGAYITTAGFPARVAGKSNKSVTFCEVWGFEHECGDCYTAGIRKISKADFEQMMLGNGRDPKNLTYIIKKLAQFDKEHNSESCKK